MASDREFRHSVSVLKKQGLLPAKTDKGTPLDARSALPAWKVKGKRLDTWVKKYDDVVSGKATAVKVPQKSLQQFRKAGFETSQNRLIVPHSKTETAKFKAGQVSIKNKSGIERVQIPVEYHNLKQYLSDIRKNARLINAMKKRNEYFGIRFYGGQRAHFYSDILSLMEDLENYETIEEGYRKSKPKQAEIYQNLEIIKLNYSGALGVEKELAERKQIMTKEYNRRHAKRVYERRKGKPGVLAAYRARRAESERERRARIKKNPATDAHYKKEARKRAAKSYRKIHPKTKRTKVAKKKK